MRIEAARRGKFSITKVVKKLYEVVPAKELSESRVGA
jgi:hypothetical protein